MLVRGGRRETGKLPQFRAVINLPFNDGDERIGGRCRHRMLDMLGAAARAHADMRRRISMNRPRRAAARR